MAAAIRNELGIEPELIKSGGGAFEIRVDGELIYSKLKAGSFPKDEDIVAALKSRSA